MIRYLMLSKDYNGDSFYYIFDIKKQIHINEKFSCIKKEVFDRCVYLNKYESAKRYKIFQDNNKRYWIFKKSKIEYSPVYDSDGVFYIQILRQENNGYTFIKQCIERINHIEKYDEYMKNTKIFKEVKIKEGI